jgi:hypothetical protein
MHNTLQMTKIWHLLHVCLLTAGGPERILQGLLDQQLQAFNVRNHCSVETGCCLKSADGDIKLVLCCGGSIYITKLLGGWHQE